LPNSQTPVSFTEYGIPIRNLWHMLLYAWNETSEHHVSMQDVESAPTLDALLATVLIKYIEQRMRIGLGRGYVSTSRRLRAVRGRVNFPESLKQQTFEHGEAECDFQQYSSNEPRNQIIRSTFVRLVQAGEFGPNRTQADHLRQRLRSLVRNLNGVELIELTPELIRRQQMAQNDNDYRLMLAVCELILMSQMPLEVEGRRPLPAVDRDLLVLHRIYERFVANFYRMKLEGWEVSAQQRLHWHAQDANEHLPFMIPDLILREKKSGRIIVLDTKFTAGSLVENVSGKLVYDSSHLYQLYAYLRSQEHLSEKHAASAGILLYPSINTQLSEHIHLQEHVIRVETVDLAAPWPDVEKELLELINKDNLDL